VLSVGVQGFGPDIQAILLIVLGVWSGACGLPIPEEIPLLTAGVLAAMGVLPVHWAIIFGLAACLSGDVAVFAVGRRIGQRIERGSRLRRLLRGRYLLRARHLYLRRGRFALCAARLVPGLKMPFLFTAGAFRMPWGQFLLRDAASLAVLVPVLVLFAYSSSLSVTQMTGVVQRIAVVCGAAFVALAAAWLAVSTIRRRRRRTWRARCVEAGIPVHSDARSAGVPASWF